MIVGTYAVELRLGFDRNGQDFGKSAQPVQLGGFQFVRTQSSVSYSDCYDIVLREK